MERGVVDGNHEEADVGEALEPLERVDTGVDVPTGVRPRLEPQLAPSGFCWRLDLGEPPLVSAPQDDSSWATRSVLGEQIWTRKPRADLPMTTSIFSAVFFLVALYSAYTQRLWRLVSFGSLALVLKLWFLERMVVYYDEHLARPWWRRLLEP